MTDNILSCSESPLKFPQLMDISRIQQCVSCRLRLNAEVAVGEQFALGDIGRTEARGHVSDGYLATAGNPQSPDRLARGILS